MDKIISNLQGLVNKNDIGTSFFSIYPKYDFSSGSPVIVGYTVYQSLTITIRGITNNNNKISRVIDAITKGGAPLTISGITYSN